MSTLNDTSNNIMATAEAAAIGKIELVYYPVSPGLNEVVLDTQVPSWGTAVDGDIALDTAVTFTVTVSGTEVTANLLRFRKIDLTDLGYKILSVNAVYPTSGTYTLPATTGVVLSVA